MSFDEQPLLKASVKEPLSNESLDEDKQPLVKKQPLPSKEQSLDGHDSEQLWSTGLFGCFDDLEACALAACCPCIAYGRIVDHVEGGGETMPAMLYLLISVLTHPIVMSVGFSPNLRRKLRAKYQLEQGAGDCLPHLCCHTCALAQELQQIKNVRITEGFPVDSTAFAAPPATQEMLN